MNRLLARCAPWLVAAALLASGCGQSAGGTPSQSPIGEPDFIQITDCVELENLAAAEVDRITATEDSETIAAATARFNRIVAHIDSVCH